MSKKKVIIATVKLAIVVDEFEPTVAFDSVSAILSENLQEKGVILDWSYPENPDGSFQYPKSIGEIEMSDYEEGDFLIYPIEKVYSFE